MQSKFHLRNPFGRLLVRLPLPVAASTAQIESLDWLPANVLKIDHVLCDHHERVIRRARNFQLAGNIFESVRCDKAMGAKENPFCWSYGQTRPFSYCRRADLELASGRLKLARVSKWTQTLIRLLRTSKDARWRIERREACARATQNFPMSPNSSLACFDLKHDLETLRGSAPRTPKSKAGKRDRERKASL
jgi:hypothetical protein